MIAVAQTIRTHRPLVARTLRETAGVGLSDLGDGLTWGEAKILLEEYASDPSTHLGAALAGWAYPASTPDLIALIAQIRDEKASKKLMPWVLKLSPKQSAPAAEVALAEAELESGIVFSA